MTLERKCLSEDDWEITSPDVVKALATPKFSHVMGRSNIVTQSTSPTTIF